MKKITNKELLDEIKLLKKEVEDLKLRQPYFVQPYISPHICPPYQPYPYYPLQPSPFTNPLIPWWQSPVLCSMNTLLGSGQVQGNVIS